MNAQSICAVTFSLCSSALAVSELVRMGVYER